MPKFNHKLAILAYFAWSCKFGIENEHITLLNVDAKEYAPWEPPVDPLLTPPNLTVVIILSLREMPYITQFRAAFSYQEERLPS